MNNYRVLKLISLLCLIAYSSTSFSAASPGSMKEDNIHVDNWNTFFSNLYAYHLYQLSQHEVYTEESTGGYSGLADFYNEVKYFRKDTNKLLSKIQWETANPTQIHVIEVFVYNNSNVLEKDYLAAFLPEYRNSPIQTLINIHYNDDELHSYRQFDASGERIYEECKGEFFAEPVFISLMDNDFNSIEESVIKTMSSEAYLSCFKHLPIRVEGHINPVKGIQLPVSIAKQAGITQPATTLDPDKDIDNYIATLTRQIRATRQPAELYLMRGQAYFITHKFEQATVDYTAALKINDSLDEAYFSRGMSLGRQGKITQGIQDLTTYIQRNPNSSLAYTKRGVRNIWAGNFGQAEKDLKQAIKLKPSNSEAHDDLGVLYARKGRYQKSIYHFKQVVRFDTSYQKGFHNLSMAYHIIGQYDHALKAINKALSLSKNEKNSLLLKGEILKSLGMEQEANNIIERAEFLPDGNWSESFSIQ